MPIKSYYEKNKEKLKNDSRIWYEKNRERRSETVKKYYENNKEKVTEYHKNYYINNKEKLKERHRIYFKNNKEKIIEQQKKYREDNKEKVTEYHKNYHINNREKIKNKVRIWYEKNKERSLEMNRRYIYNRYHADPNFKLTINLRNRFYKELREHLSTKKESSLVLVGCSIKKLKQYLESKFEEGMTWDNWSKYGWHIDHIIPCSSFDLTKEEEQKKCFHYTNLQPLWAKDNMEKSNKLDWVKECT